MLCHPLNRPSPTRAKHGSSCTAETNTSNGDKLEQTTNSPSTGSAAQPASKQYAEPQVYLTLVDTSNGVFPTKVHINRGRRTKITIGRSDESDIVVRQQKHGKKINDKICVSRLHCEIEKNPCGEWALFDKGSRNGCFVNGYKVSSHVLQDGDLIVLGGGGIVQSGQHVQNVESIFQYKFSREEPKIKKNLSGVKRKLHDCTSAPGPADQGIGKRSSGDKENCRADCITPPLSSPSCSGTTGPSSTELHDELSCGICLDVQVHPRVLGCGHSFCARCISTALGYQNRCPSCKAVITSDPQKVVSLENAICSIYCKNPEYQTRRQEYDKLVQHERITSEKLMHVISKARSNGKRFLIIDKKWNKQEQEIFRKGVALYKGQARIEYCRTVSLTDAFIKKAKPAQLFMMALNVGVNAKDCSVKNRLRMFIRYG